VVAGGMLMPFVMNVCKIKLKHRGCIQRHCQSHVPVDTKTVETFSFHWNGNDRQTS